ncbi:tetratricopeptide repeat protein [Hymenobacter sp. PAMC 26628]|uniref:tetratricopeptide repeat protein n=1 Tax=Hymenobacter sp. PAMC 26628 TaxID=1484118 RepID=UPI000770192C|nr:hypothetical protein [Hymenobacter sp. PAMC 26628]AMJ66365.1 hypothetical protein AXW84_13680 [Hymenobacter sp. PAMC 26628]
MKKLLLALACSLGAPAARAQDVNCALYPPGSPCRRACDLYESPAREATSQGSARSQQYFDEVLALCPTFAAALREKAVPYLKRGDFGTWKKMMDEVVRLQPAQYLGYRGWCRFEFLRDYQGAAADLTRLLALTHGNAGYSNDGDYDLRIVLALCKRELGDPRGALAVFNQCIQANEAQQRVGLYDYLHRGVTRLRTGDYAGALRDFKREQGQAKELADTEYYVGLAYRRQKNKALARQHFVRAEALFQQGHRRYHDYCEPLDAVYLADIQQALASR